MKLYFQDWFAIGMKRSIPDFIEPGERVLTVGGKEVTDDKLYRPHWDAMTQPLYDISETHGRCKIEDGSIDTIWSNHFLEHLPGNRAVEMLREFERVLKIGGTANIVVPYYNSSMQAHDPDHKSAWNEGSWTTILKPEYYFDHGAWALKVHACFIVGIVERNLALFTQLVKV
jgi:hypothetical protein